MPQNGRYILLAALALLTIGGLALWAFLQGTDADDGNLVRWGQGPLAVSEAAYYESRVGEIVHAWQRRWRTAEVDAAGRFRQPSGVYLVIDTTQPALWLEDRGQVLEAYRCELPAQMTWSLFGDEGSGPQPLPGVARFQRRGVNTDQLRPEMISLKGSGKAGGSMVFSFDCTTYGGDHAAGVGLVSTSWAPPPRKADVDYYESIVVAEAEYEEARRAWVTEAAPGLSTSPAQSPVDARQAAWRRVEKKLYQEIENQLAQAGYALQRLEVTAGPDFSAAHARFDGVCDSVLRRFGGSSLAAGRYLAIDHLGDDIWYVKNAADPRRPGFGSGPAEPDFEFVVSAAGAVPKAEVAGWIAQGREKQKPTVRPPAKWRATLPNGVTVELLGLCESPSGGKSWWGPDGHDLGFAPYFHSKPFGWLPSDRRICEIAWRVLRPAGFRSVHTTMSAEGARGSYSQEIRDRYGNRILADLQAQAFDFDPAQTRTTWTVGIGSSEQDLQYVRFKDISLVRGENQGFVIEAGK